MVFKFIKAAYSDRGYLLSLRKLTMVEHLENAGLFLTGQQHNERVDEQYDCSHLIQFNGDILGTLKYKIWGSHIEIMQLQIHPNHQNKGYGRGVIEQVIKTAKLKPIKLTVLKNNPAKALYTRLGFKITEEDNYEYHMQTQPINN
ncbi:GNAT family N-acetyltransferase [Pseudoalteromonas carrageenovora]|uniref:GNAT family N-acetyltransferase n=1 Tax=Pseudoalteromonas carrageenovora TaxID=227 RepID=UPI0021199A81|nr:GNAT family N-acetyltransferase [Pseudoalteromonas carrageenovora]MCQ8889626.1 GNAT family N-acetyltransferase [Pseudoalteromonas carrageenovora]